MSGPLIANMLLDVMAHDWTDVALVDVEHLVDRVGKTDAIMKWVISIGRSCGKCRSKFE